MDWNTLVKERNEWVAHNFPDNHIPLPEESILGMIEETGELSHAFLKFVQSIREYDMDKYECDARDAIGDLTIYMLGVMSHGEFVPERIPREYSERPAHCIKAVANFVGLVAVNPSQYYCEKIIAYLRQYCVIEGWDYEATVLKTWKEVQRRDWIAYPETGLPPEPDGGHYGGGGHPAA